MFLISPMPGSRGCGAGALPEGPERVGFYEARSRRPIIEASVLIDRKRTQLVCVRPDLFLYCPGSFTVGSRYARAGRLRGAVGALVQLRVIGFR
ncbi:hypothetical protein EVAR_36559_1 [Eumeta japonica]|uniref:Uncharacterized protein n=1 Tax=Eumeta variegata TaxID=151549 RepID=A0A4C1Y2L1_EUMVA|nr:hypothetical protein EVAR_36559_1 [Eumeta japonica]